MVAGAIAATIGDPKVYTKSWTLGVTHTRGPAGNEILEYAGVEGDVAVQTAERSGTTTRARRSNAYFLSFLSYHGWPSIFIGPSFTEY